MKPAPSRPIELDGSTGEGGGQLVRIAVALAAVATVPIRIVNVRGQRGDGVRGGGLKAQHVASIAWLAAATDARVSGLAVGSRTLEFVPRRRPSEFLAPRRVEIEAETAAASALLMLQAVMPFLLFAGGEEAREVVLRGGTNVSWSLSWEYLDQVLLPALEEGFGVRVERRLEGRGWSLGPRAERGRVALRIHPLGRGEALMLRDEAKRDYGPEDFKVKVIDVSILAPESMHAGLQQALTKDIGTLLPGVEINLKVLEDSHSDARIYVLLVARSETLRWGRDILCSAPKKKNKGKASKKAEAAGSEGKTGKELVLAEDVSRKVCRDLCKELALKGTVDEFLQDQLVVFQALAKGRTSFTRNEDTVEGVEEAVDGIHIDGRERRDKAQEPFGEGSTHTRTARWVTAELLPGVGWFNKGRLCEGVGMQVH